MISNNYGMAGCDNDFVSETDDYQYYTVAIQTRSGIHVTKIMIQTIM